MNKFYITTPIYYVNAEPHIGHAYTTIASDILARYQRFSGKDVFFLSGTDEHGEKIEEKAKKEGMKPKEFTDKISEKFKNSWKNINISYDNFIRTTDIEHIKAVQNALQYMHDKGDIYLGEYKGLYCRGCEQFLSEKDLVNGECPDHKIKPEEVSEESYMFKMSSYQKELIKKIENDEFKIRPIERKNEILSFYKKEGLNDVSFSRKNLQWGIPLPWDKKHTAYVWADAFLNYLTGLGWDGNPNNKPSMWSPDIQFLGKDILRVHSTIWPAMLLSLGLPLPKVLFVHGFFLIDGQKMSKTIGNVISPDDLFKRYGADATRYLLMSATVFGHDGDISFKKFDEKYNADLANGLGNIASRVSNMLDKNNIKINLKENSDKNLINNFKVKIENYKFSDALNVLWDELRKNDEELSKKEPWKKDDKKEIKEILEPISQNIFNVVELLRCFMPESSEKIIEQFKKEQIKKIDSLFPRIIN